MILEKINELKRERNITDEEFCVMMEVSINTVRNYLTGKTQMPVNQLQKIAKYFGYPAGYFFDENTDYKKNFHVDKVEHNGNGHIINAKNINNGSTNKDELFLLHENELLKERIRGLEKEIEGKNKIIELYQKFTDEYEDELNSK